MSRSARKGCQRPLRNELDPAAIPWGANPIDVVVECTGVFTKREKLEKHLPRGFQNVSALEPVP